MWFFLRFNEKPEKSLWNCMVCMMIFLEHLYVFLLDTFSHKWPSDRVLCRFLIKERIAIFSLWLCSRRGMSLNSSVRTKIHYKPCNLDAFLCPVGRESDFQYDGTGLYSNIELKLYFQPLKKMGNIFCLRKVKTIFNLMICWELRLKLRLEYRTIRSFKDKLTCQFWNNLLPHACRAP